MRSFSLGFLLFFPLFLPVWALLQLLLFFLLLSVRCLFLLLSVRCLFRSSFIVLASFFLSIFSGMRSGIVRTSYQTRRRAGFGLGERPVIVFRKMEFVKD